MESEAEALGQLTSDDLEGKVDTDSFFVSHLLNLVQLCDFLT